MTVFQEISNVHDFRWPSGDSRTVATFSIEPDLIARRSGLQFYSGHDDLDYFRSALVRLASGRVVALHRYERAPVNALELWIDVGDDPQAAVQETVATFSIADSEVSWRAPSDWQRANER